MRNIGWVALMWLLACFATTKAAKTAFEYPSAMLDIYDAGQSCWVGMGVLGDYVVRVVPQVWLVGAPPSEYSAVTFPADEWVDLLFSGRIVPADGNDLELIEWGRAGERALVFLTDGSDQECPVGIAKADASGEELPTYIGMELPRISLPFVPRALRIVALDRGGASPGFDLASARAWVSHDCGAGALNPNPVSGEIDVRPDVRLDWTPGCQAKEHIIYLAADMSQVVAAAPEARRATQPRDANIFEPQALQLGQTYYWRVDEVLPDNSLVLGPVWHFTVGDHVLIDDFELYSDTGLSIYDSWLERDLARQSLASQTIWHSCQQSLMFKYYYSGGDYSEVYHPFAEPQDWLHAGARVLQFWLYGAPGNATSGQMYISLSDAGKQETVPYLDTTVLTQSQWTVCRVDLSRFVQVDLADVRSLGIGFRLLAGVPNQEYRGTIYIDDVALYPAVCLENERPSADLNADCAVNYKDLDRMASQWLASRTRMCEVAEPNTPILWYEFNGNVDDSMGNAPGQIDGRPVYAAGKHGQAIAFRNDGDAVMIPQASSLFARTREAITIAFWQFGDDSTHLNDTLCCSNYTYGESAPSISINLGCWRNPGQYRWDCGTPWSFANRLAGHHSDKLEWAGRWNHWAFTKDIRVTQAGTKGRMEIYLNGELYDSRWGTDSPIEGITSFEIGSGWYGRYDGLIDDFQIYDYALSAPEMAYLASDGTGVLEAAVPPTADLDHSDRVDFKDFAVLASQWLSEGLWP